MRDTHGHLCTTRSPHFGDCFNLLDSMFCERHLHSVEQNFDGAVSTRQLPLAIVGKICCSSQNVHIQIIQGTHRHTIELQMVFSIFIVHALNVWTLLHSARTIEKERARERGTYRERRQTDKREGETRFKKKSTQKHKATRQKKQGERVTERAKVREA